MASAFVFFGFFGALIGVEGLFLMAAKLRKRRRSRRQEQLMIRRMVTDALAHEQWRRM